jgi:hypothetical protein
MPRRTAILAAVTAMIVVAVLAALPAAAQTATQAVPSAPPALAAAVQPPAPAPAPAAAPDAAWLRPEPQRSIAPALPGDAQSPLAPFQATSCIVQCIKNTGQDGVCCGYICHPIGEDPC